MSIFTYYAQRLQEEQEQLEAVEEALKALNINGFYNACRRINNKLVQRAAEQLTAIREIGDALETLEVIESFLNARINYLKPLAKEEQRRIKEEDK